MAGSMASDAVKGLVDLRRLQQFVAVVEAGSLTDAAAELHQSQQALSVAIKSLEEQVGARLFERTRGMRPSAAGLRLYESATVLLAGAERIVPDVRRSMSGDEEVVRVGYTPSITSVEVFDLVTGALPDRSSVHVKRMFPDEMTAALYSGEIDLAFRRDLAKPEGLTGGVVAFDRMNVAVVAGSAVAQSQPVSMADLVDLSMILWAPESVSRYSSYLVDHFRHAGYEPDTVICRFQGFAAESAPLAVPDGFAMVTAEPGVYYGGRIVVVALREEIKCPIVALALPTTTGAAREVLAALGDDARRRRLRADHCVDHGMH
ncbi:LysR family transcriptional regulator [Gordonia phthalatica]|uniref:LysR family transcriptional regulator n=1 Tax=Gordonia phthalatica TaxID=1136941 RepID=UPI001D04AA30|nr:LysR family transcriptional regulator [Gordonia phthalatica]